jgi:hypothetical protein
MLNEGKKMYLMYLVFKCTSKSLKAHMLNFSALKLLLSPKHDGPPLHCLLTLPKHYSPPLHCLFTFPKYYGPTLNFFYITKTFSPSKIVSLHSQKLISPVFDFDFVLENGGCLKK